MNGNPNYAMFFQEDPLMKQQRQRQQGRLEISFSFPEEQNRIINCTLTSPLTLSYVRRLCSENNYNFLSAYFNDKKIRPGHSIPLKDLNVSDPICVHTRRTIHFLYISGKSEREGDDNESLHQDAISFGKYLLARQEVEGFIVKDSLFNEMQSSTEWYREYNSPGQVEHMLRLYSGLRNMDPSLTMFFIYFSGHSTSGGQWTANQKEIMTAEKLHEIIQNSTYPSRFRVVCDTCFSSLWQDRGFDVITSSAAHLQPGLFVQQLTEEEVPLFESGSHILISSYDEELPQSTAKRQYWLHMKNCPKEFRQPLRALKNVFSGNKTMNQRKNDAMFIVSFTIHRNTEGYLPTAKKGQIYYESPVGKARDGDTKGKAGQRRVVILVEHMKDNTCVVRAEYISTCHYGETRRSGKPPFYRINNCKSVEISTPEEG